MSEQATTDAVDEAVAESEAPVAEEAQIPNGETSDDTEETDDEDVSTSDEDLVDFEHEGKSFKIPKELNRGFLREEDYTRKTQELAQQREAVESHRREITQQAEAQAATLEERATLKALDAQLAQFDALDWAAYQQQHGSEAAITAQGQWQQLQRARAGLETEITRKEAEHRSNSESQRSTVLRDAVQQLTAEIPGFTPDLDVKVTKTATTLGFTPQELRESLIGADGKPDTRSYRVLAELTRLMDFEAKHKAKTTTAQTAQKQAAVQPAKTVGQRAGAFKAGLDDDLPPKVWLERRNAQIAAQAKAQGR